MIPHSSLERAPVAQAPVGATFWSWAQHALHLSSTLFGAMATGFFLITCIAALLFVTPMLAIPFAVFGIYAVTSFGVPACCGVLVEADQASRAPRPDASRM